MSNDYTSIVRFSTFDELKNIESEWDELYLLSEINSHYLTFEFVQLWYSCFATPDQIRIVRIVEDKLTIGFLPLVMSSSKGFRTLSSLTNYHCMHCGALVRKGYGDVFQTFFLKQLFETYHCWDILKFSYSYDFDQFPGLLSAEKLNAEKICWLRQFQPTYSISPDLGFDIWVKKQLSKKTYKTYKDLLNKYKKSSSWSLQQFCGQDALAQWNTFLELENSGWKGTGGSSIKKLPENYSRYYQALVAELAERGDLTISLLEYENKYIAAAFMYREGDILHVFKAGFDEDFRHLSPSNMLLMENIKIHSELAEPPKILHLFPGDFGYKDKYASTEIQCSFTQIFNNNFRGKIAYSYRKFKNLVKAKLPNR